MDSFDSAAVRSHFRFACRLASSGASAATIPTATFENLRGQFLGVAPFTDPLSGINFYELTGHGLGASYFNATSSSFPSLYHDNTVLVQNSPQANGLIIASWDFSLHAALPIPGQTVGLDALYTGEYGNFNSMGAIYLLCYDSAGRIVATAQTPLIPTSTTAWLQTHLSASAATPSIVSFDVISHDLATSYDNFAVAVPEPTAAGGCLAGVAVLLRRRRRQAGFASAG